MASEHKADDAGKAETAAAGSGAETSGSSQASTAEPASDAASAAGESFSIDGLMIEVETLKGQIADLTGRLLRAHADMDNLRKRAEREKQETARYAISKFARDTVEVADNFARAIAAVPPEVAEQNAQLKALLEGVSMTERAFVGVLERHGVKQVGAVGDAFNPQYHQAVMNREDKTVAAGTLLEVFQPGYVIEDRCLRTAMVVVSTGGPKASKATPAQEQPAEPKPETVSAEHRAEAENSAEPEAKPDGSDGTASPEAAQGPEKGGPEGTA
ncbi:MAG: nucleotide exchange factor GrpE [Hyphomicrobiaceae bacterium]